MGESVILPVNNAGKQPFIRRGGFIRRRSTALKIESMARTSQSLPSDSSKLLPLIADGLKFALLMTVVTWLMIRATEGLGYHWQWYRIPRYLLSISTGEILLGPLLKGLSVTFQIAAVSLCWPWHSV